MVCDSLEVLYRSDRAGRGARLLARLETLTGRESGAARARVLYWKCVVRGGDSIGIWRRDALELVDSARYPYFHARLAMLRQPVDKSNFLCRHDALRSSVAYFGRVRDTVLEMFAYRNLGAFYLGIGDVDGFRHSALAVESLCLRMERDTMVAKSRLNRALGYILLGDSAEARGILRELESNSLVTSDSDFLGRVYLDLGMACDSPEYMRRAIDVSPSFRRDAGKRASIEFGMMKIYEGRGDRASADSLLMVLRPLVEEGGDAQARTVLHSMVSRRARERGDWHTAFVEMEEAHACSDSVFGAKDRAEVDAANFRNELARQEKMRERDRQLSLARLLAVSALLLFAAGAVTVYFRSRHQAMRTRQIAREADMARLELRLEREKHTVRSMTIAMRERDGLMNEVRQVTTGMHEEGRISTDIRNDIERRLKMSELTQREWDDLQRAYLRVHPHFISILKERYPGLTEGDIWLAFYIAAGLTTKQIAQVMHLQPNSVKKNRQRLRQRMGISADVSLEDCLRELLAEGNEKGRPQCRAAGAGI